MTKRKLVGILGAIVLAIAGTVALVTYVRGAEDRATAGEELVDVFVVKQLIRAGTVAGQVPDLVKVEQVPVKVRPRDALVSFQQIEGKVAGVDLFAGEQLLTGRFVNPVVEELTRTAAVAVPEGYHEVTIELDPKRAIGGRIRAGDQVGVVASFSPFDLSEVNPDPARGVVAIEGAGKTPNTSFMTLHKILVTNVQGATANPIAPGQPNTAVPGGKLLVTLALDVAGVERLVFAAEYGTVWLSYEPQNASEEGSKIVTRGNVYIDTRGTKATAAGKATATAAAKTVTTKK